MKYKCHNCGKQHNRPEFINGKIEYQKTFYLKVINKYDSDFSVPHDISVIFCKGGCFEQYELKRILLGKQV